MPIKLFVGNLPEDCPEETIRDLFSPYGNIDDVVVIKNYGFVKFLNEDDAMKAAKDLNQSKLSGKTIIVEASKPKAGDNRGGNQDNRDRRDGGRGRGHGDRGARDRDRGNRGGRDDRGARRDYDGPGGPSGRSGPGLGPLIGGLGNLNGLSALGGLGGLGAAPLGAPLGDPIGGALGAPLGAPLGGLGILSAVNTLAAVAEKKQQLDSVQQAPPQEQPQRQQPQSSNQDQPDPDVRVRREVVHTQDVPNAAAMGLGSGYVIYERYYVDGNHRLLQGLSLSHLPRMSDNRPDAKQANHNEARENRNQNLYRDRSPVNGSQDYDRYNF